MNWFQKLFGLTYLVNEHTKEIHNLENEKKNCSIGMIAKHNKRHITRTKAIKLILNGKYNGCRWCLKKYDKG